MAKKKKTKDMLGNRSTIRFDGKRIFAIKAKLQKSLQAQKVDTTSPPTKRGRKSCEMLWKGRGGQDTSGESYF